MGRRRKSPAAKALPTQPGAQPTANVSGEMTVPEASPKSPWPPTDFDRQVDEVIRWIASGESDSGLFDQVHKKWPKQDAAAICEEAIRRIMRSVESGPDFVLGFALHAAGEVHRRALATGDYAQALKAVVFLADLAERVR